MGGDGYRWSLHAIVEGEQTRRLESRIDDPRKVWKLSDLDLLSYTRWDEYGHARDAMIAATSSSWAPWFVAHSDDKKRARLNCISHILSMIPYKKVPKEKINMPRRSNKGAYDDQSVLKGRRFVADKY